MHVKFKKLLLQEIIGFHNLILYEDVFTNAFKVHKVDWIAHLWVVAEDVSLHC